MSMEDFLKVDHSRHEPTIDFGGYSFFGVTATIWQQVNLATQLWQELQGALGTEKEYGLKKAFIEQVETFNDYCAAAYVSAQILETAKEEMQMAHWSFLDFYLWDNSCGWTEVTARSWFDEYYFDVSKDLVIIPGD